MDPLKVIANNGSSAYVPSLELTKGQPPPIAANGGLSFMSFERDGEPCHRIVGPG